MNVCPNWERMKMKILVIGAGYVDFGPVELTAHMNNKVIIDGRRAFANRTIPVDIIYRTIGKPPTQ